MFQDHLLDFLITQNLGLAAIKKNTKYLSNFAQVAIALKDPNKTCCLPSP